MEQEGKPKKLIYLDQVHSALKDFRGVESPNFAVERAINRTLDHLSNAYPTFEIVHKNADGLSSEVMKRTEGKGVVFLDYHTFRNEVTAANSIEFAVSRGRFYPPNASPGKGPITGKGRTMRAQRDEIVKKFPDREVILVDDLLTTGWTFTKVVPYLTEAGIKVVAIGVAITNQPIEQLSISDKTLPIYAGYQINPKEDVEAYELKNFLAIPGSGVPYLKGAVADNKQIAGVRQSLKKYLAANKDASLLRRELFALELDFEEGELLRKVSQMVGTEPDTEELVDILQSVKLPNFKSDIVGSTRALYIGDYHSPAWRMTDEIWEEFSKRQIETSIRLYEDIRNTNSASVTVGQLGIFDELMVGPTMSVEHYLAEKLKSLDPT